MDYLDDKFTEELEESYKRFIDKMIEEARLNDKESYEKFQWLDKLAQKEGISFYDKVRQVLNKFDAEDKAKQWIEERNK